MSSLCKELIPQKNTALRSKNLSYIVDNDFKIIYEKYKLRLYSRVVNFIWEGYNKSFEEGWKVLNLAIKEITNLNNKVIFILINRK